jgi:predicted short-subunit dehydrogenase-like oxidoreductase (DUF2520 family)
MDIDIFARPTTFALVGAGTVGTAVACLLERDGHEIRSVFSPSGSSARRSADRTGAHIAPSIAQLPEVDAFLIGASDPFIPEVARALAARDDIAGSKVVHFAGAIGMAPLQPATERGAIPAALHPVQACPEIDIAIERLPGSAWGITTGPGGEEWAEGLVKAVGGNPVAVPEHARAMWHASAVVTSNGIAALLTLGEAILTAVGIEAPEKVLGPLAAGAVANAREGGGGGATLTGPVVRGDAGAIRLHLDALQRSAPHLLPDYILASRSILGAAVGAGRIDAATAQGVEVVLDAAGSGASR